MRVFILAFLAILCLIAYTESRVIASNDVELARVKRSSTEVQVTDEATNDLANAQGNADGEKPTEKNKKNKNKKNKNKRNKNKKGKQHKNKGKHPKGAKKAAEANPAEDIKKQ